MIRYIQLLYFAEIAERGSVPYASVSFLAMFWLSSRGVAAMTRSRFTMFNVTGALIWVIGVSGAGYLFGNIPWVKANLSIIIWALILVPGLIAIYGAWKAGRAEKKQAAAQAAEQPVEQSAQAQGEAA